MKKHICLLMPAILLSGSMFSTSYAYDAPTGYVFKHQKTEPINSKKSPQKRTEVVERLDNKVWFNGMTTIPKQKTVRLPSANLSTKQKKLNTKNTFPYKKLTQKSNGVSIDSLDKYMHSLNIKQINGFIAHNFQNYLGINVPSAFDNYKLIHRFDSTQHTIALYRTVDTYHTNLILIIDKQSKEYIAYDISDYNLNAEEDITAAFIQNNILYISHSYSSYPTSVHGITGYMSAIGIDDLSNPKTLWNSDPLVSNSDSFVITDQHIVTGYGFTSTPDFLYVLDKKSGKTLSKMPIKTAADYILQQDNKLYVRTYDTDYVFSLKKAKP